MTTTMMTVTTTSFGFANIVTPNSTPWNKQKSTSAAAELSNAAALKVAAAAAVDSKAASAVGARTQLTSASRRTMLTAGTWVESTMFKTCAVWAVSAAPSSKVCQEALTASAATAPAAPPPHASARLRAPQNGHARWRRARRPGKAARGVGCLLATYAPLGTTQRSNAQRAPALS